MPSNLPLRALLFLALISLGLVSPAVGQPCVRWSDEFTPIDIEGGSVLCTTVFNDGSGPALFVGGDFTEAGGASAVHIAKWNGSAWSSVGGGMNSIQGSTGVFALAVFDDGSGPHLYAGGHFQQAGGAQINEIAKWTGSAWVPLGTATGTNNEVHALAVWNDGTGSALFAGGRFTTIGGTNASLIAKWNGSSWSSVGGGLAIGRDQLGVGAFAVFNDGSGPSLVAGGDFSAAGGTAASGVAKWNGSVWQPINGLHEGQLLPFVRTLAVFDDGSGSRLFAGGDLCVSAVLPPEGIAAWDGSSWQSVGGGFPHSSGGASTVYSLRVWDDGTGQALYAGGDFHSRFNEPAPGEYVARWNGTAWSPLTQGTDGPVYALADFDDGIGTSLVLLGSFGRAGSVYSRNMALWTGLEWIPRGNGFNEVGSPVVLAITPHDDGTGSAVIAAGAFRAAGGISASNIARWDGEWKTLGGGITGQPRALLSNGNSSSPVLYAAGDISLVNGTTTPANGIAAWDGTSWAPLGGGILGRGQALAFFDSGGGDDLYVSGAFPGAGGVSAPFITYWDGQDWHALPGLDRGAYDLAVFDDGSGPALYAAGDFRLGTDQGRWGFAKWTGTTWERLGAGMVGTTKGRALAVFDDGSGPALFCGGTMNYPLSGGGFARAIMKWDGSQWHPVGPGGFPDEVVNDLLVFDDGSGSALYAVGVFGSLGGVANTQGLAKLRNGQWSAVGPNGFQAFGNVLVAHDDGSGMALYVGGSFYGVANGVDAAMIARWNGSAWSAVGTGMNNPVQSMASVPNGPAAGLYAGGSSVTTADGMPVNRLAKWNGSSWGAVGTGLPVNGSQPLAMAAVNEGGSNVLYLGGIFSNAGGVPVNNLARWDGSAWSAAPGVAGAVRVLKNVTLDGNPVIAIGGDFGMAGVETAPNIARWDGTAWHALGLGLNGGAFAMTSFDDGTGTRLYVGGEFSTAGGIAAGGMARWDGASWSPLAGSFNGSIYAMTVFDYGLGPALYVAGGFTKVNGVTVNRIVKWTGSGWSSLGSGVNGQISSLATYDDGTGPALYATGDFTLAGGISAKRIARWDGTAWSAVEAGLNDSGYVLATATQGSLTHLYAGGAFVSAGAVASAHIAKWGPCPPGPGDYCPSDYNRDGFVDPLDYNAYINAFESADMAADFNHDGFLDPLDYNGFINAFEAGC